MIQLLARRKPAVLDAYLYRGIEDKVELLDWLKARRKTGYGIADRVTKVILDTPDRGRLEIRSDHWVLHLGKGRFEVHNQAEFDSRFDLIGSCE